VPRALYTTIARMRALGITAVAVPDADLLRLIAAASSFVEAQTGQFFAPRYEVGRWNGKGDPLTHRPDLVPILQLDSVEIDYDKTTGELTGMERVLGPSGSFRAAPRRFPFGTSGSSMIADSDYQLTHDNRVLQLVGGWFPRGRGNVVVNGAFGWLEGFGDKHFETTTAADISEGDTEIELTELSNATGWIGVDDVLDVIVSPASVSAPADILQLIVQAVDALNNKVTVDAVTYRGGLPIAAGADVKVYGQIPVDIRRLVEALVLQYASGSGGGGGIDPNRIIMERTDGYSYQLESSASRAQAAGGGLGVITGDVQLDLILARYSQPPYVGFV